MIKGPTLVKTWARCQYCTRPIYGMVPTEWPCTCSICLDELPEGVSSLEDYQAHISEYHLRAERNEGDS